MDVLLTKRKCVLYKVLFIQNLTKFYSFKLMLLLFTNNVIMVYCARDVEFIWGARGSAPHTQHFVSNHRVTTNTQDPMIIIYFTV